MNSISLSRKDKVGSTNLILKLGLTLIEVTTPRENPGFPKTKIDCRESLFPGGKWVKLFSKLNPELLLLRAKPK